MIIRIISVSITIKAQTVNSECGYRHYQKTAALLKHSNPQNVYQKNSMEYLKKYASAKDIYFVIIIISLQNSLKKKAVHPL